MIQKEIDKFLKCDLHLHSSSDYSRKYSRVDFIEKIRKADLDVISITDHNIIDVDLYNDLMSDENIHKSIIGGCELNVSLSVEEIKKYNLTVKSDFFHGIIWFDNNDLDLMWTTLKKYIKDNNSDMVDIDNIKVEELSKRLSTYSFELDKLQSYIKNINYYFIFHENKGDRNLSDYLDNSTIENEKYKEKLFYYNNNLALDGAKRNKKITSYFEKSLNTIVASFLFSDAKTIDEIGQKFSWINFDGSFKNLILAISDPDVRICRSDETSENPQKNEFDYLESIKFNTINKATNKKVEEVELVFNPGLNGIIGSRGSGKTMLGNILGNCNLSNYKDFVDIKSIQYKLKDADYSKESPKCKYLQQNTLLKIYENGDYKSLGFIGEYYKKILEEKEKEIRDNISKIRLILSDEKKELVDCISKYNKLSSTDFLNNKPKGEIILQDIGDFELPNNLEEIKEIIKNINNIDENLESVKENIDEISFTKKYPESEVISSVVNNYKKDMNDIITSLITRKEKFLKDVSEYNYVTFIKRNKYINGLSDIIEKINTTENNQVKIFEDKYKNLIDYFKGMYRINKIIYENKKSIDELYLNLFKDDISKSIKMDSGDEIIVTTNIIKEKEYCEVLSEQFKNYTNYHEFITKMIIHSNDLNDIKELFNGTKYKGLNNINQYIDRLYKNIMEFFDSFLEIKLKIEYKGKDLNNYSPGKRSEILLEIFLQGYSLDNKDYKYIILDQPEDNLDTNTIIKKLVDKIKKMKLNKQLFIISHSAPVIVNGDSDLVVYSEENNDIITYQSGRINNAEIRKHIVDVLDGGEKNLKMRLNKYDFNYEEEE